MANGKRGDNPVSDICDYGLAVFTPTADALIKEINALLPRYLIRDLYDWSNLPTMQEFEKLLYAKRDELREDARRRQWDIQDE